MTKIKLKYVILIRVAYMFTLFILCAGITAAITSIPYLHESMPLTVLSGTLIFVIGGCADMYLVLHRHWSLVLILWVVPLMLFVLVRAIYRREDVVQYSVSAAKTVATTALMQNENSA